MIQFNTDDILISATSVEAIFSDGTILGDQDCFNVSLLSGTALGDELWIEGHRRISQEQEQQANEELYTIRLIVITPDKDWRTSATYAWKLDSAWMSSPPSLTSPSDPSWLHWNVESYIDSVIQVDDSNQILECDELELNFRSIRETRTSTRYSNPLVPRMERVTLKGLRLGLGFNRSGVYAGTDYISPCASQPCVVVDGIDQGGAGRDKQDAVSLGTSSISSPEWEAGSQAVALLLALLVTASFIVTMVCYRRYHQTKLYDRLTPVADENLTIKVEDSYQNTTHNEPT